MQTPEGVGPFSRGKKSQQKTPSERPLVGCRCFYRRVGVPTLGKVGEGFQELEEMLAAEGWMDFFAKQKLLVFFEKNKSSLKFKRSSTFCRSQMTFECFFWVMNFNGLVLQPSWLNKSRSYILPILHICMQLSIFDASLTWLEGLYLDTLQKLTSPLLPGMRSLSTEKGRHGS